MQVSFSLGEVSKRQGVDMPRMKPGAGDLGSGNRPDLEIEYLALKELRQSDGPVGSWRIRAALRAAGVEMSESIAGRLLRDLDLRGLTRPFGTKGRLLSEAGIRYFEELQQARLHDAYERQFLQRIRAETLEDVLDLLRVRRAVEADTARLAAQRATEAEIARIEQTIDKHIEQVSRGGRGQELNREIHLLVARAAKRRVLEAVVELILRDQRLYDIQYQIERVAGVVRPAEHRRILQAIRDGQPEAAAQAMQAHIDRAIGGVERFVAATKGDLPLESLIEQHTLSK
ncbi:MAG: FadR/GntR family transcriptional regulator [Chloroflexota bacterium]